MGVAADFFPDGGLDGAAESAHDLLLDGRGVLVVLLLLQRELVLVVGDGLEGGDLVGVDVVPPVGVVLRLVLAPLGSSPLPLLGLLDGQMGNSRDYKNCI